MFIACPRALGQSSERPLFFIDGSRRLASHRRSATGVRRALLRPTEARGPWPVARGLSIASARSGTWSLVEDVATVFRLRESTAAIVCDQHTDRSGEAR